MGLRRLASGLLLLGVILLAISPSGLLQAQGPDKADWNSWGYNLSNHRYNANEKTITPANVEKLTLKWAFAFDNTMIPSSHPSVVGDTVYFGGWNGNVYALDTKTGQQQWRFFTGITGTIGIVRVAPVIAGNLVLFGDQLGRFYAVNKSDGSLAWINNTFEKHSKAQITGSPVVYGDRVYVPMASREEGAGREASYSCCTFRGSLTALNLSDGTVAWRFYTVDEAKPTGLKDEPMGPSGVAIWSTPAIDPDAGLIYVTTGNSYSPPVSPNSDAILAINLKEGTLRWSKQLTPADWFNEGCKADPPVNCKGEPGDDMDFSSSALLVTAGDKKLVVGIQKNGNMTALDATNGDIVWKQSVGKATAINWGAAFDGKRIYTGDASYDRQGGLYAIDPATGKILWQNDKMPSCVPGPNVPEKACWSGNMTAVSSTPGIVWIGAMDGQFYAFDSETGKMLWSYNTARTIKTVNGVQGQGGSIGPTNATIANGQVYVMSGYAKWNDSFMEGNALFVFSLPQIF